MKRGSRDAQDAAFAGEQLERIAEDPTLLVTGEDLAARLESLVAGDSAKVSEPEALMVLFYDGEAEQANFPVMTPDGWAYVHAAKGKFTGALTPAIAKVLLEGKKGFTVASTVTTTAE